MLSRPGPLPSAQGDLEVEWDGFRAVVSTKRGLRIRSRRGWDMTPALPELAGMPSGLVLDGELVPGVVASLFPARREAHSERRRLDSPEVHDL